MWKKIYSVKNKSGGKYCFGVTSAVVVTRVNIGTLSMYTEYVFCYEILWFRSGVVKRLDIQGV